MTPEELRKLADEATPGPDWKEIWHVRPTRSEAKLYALAPDLARLCAELGEHLADLDPLMYDPKIERALAKLSELQP